MERVRCFTAESVSHASEYSKSHKSSECLLIHQAVQRCPITKCHPHPVFPVLGLRFNLFFCSDNPLLSLPLHSDNNVTLCDTIRQEDNALWLDFQLGATRLRLQGHCMNAAGDGRPPGHKPGPLQPKSDTASHSGCPDVECFCFCFLIFLVLENTKCRCLMSLFA